MLKICGNYYFSHIPAYNNLASFVYIKYDHCVNYVVLSGSRFCSMVLIRMGIMRLSFRAVEQPEMHCIL